MKPAVAIRVENASKTYAGRQAAATQPAAVALRDVSFDVLHGEIFGLIGPNGAGKSTLMRMIGALLTADTGRISVLGHDVAAQPRQAQAVINSLPLEASFFKKLSPVENLLHGARLTGMRPGDTRRRVLETLGRLGMSSDEINRPMEALSQGMQQKVAIARAFLGEPRVLLLDKPTAGLDPRARREVHDFMRALRDGQGTTFLLATHDLQEAETLCDRIAVVNQGEMAAIDTPANLKRRLGRGPDGAAASLEDVYLALTGQAEQAIIQ